MPIHELVRVIRQPFNSGRGGKYGLEFIRCVGRRQPQIQEVWTFADGGITREVHTFACVDVGAFSRDCFHTDYFDEHGRRVYIYSRKSINGSVEWLGVPRFGCNDGPPWTDHLLCPSPHWGDGARAVAWSWCIQPDGRYVGVDVPWSVPIPVCADCLPQSSENARATARRVCDACLREHRLARAQNLSDSPCGP